MSDLILFTFSAAMGFFAIMNPLGNAPIFVSLVSRYSNKAKKAIALKAVFTSFIIITVFAITGQLIFKLFGLSLPAFQLAGGILIFKVGQELLQGKESKIVHFNEDESSDRDAHQDLAVSPLAIPILAGPGTISTAINFATQNNSIIHTGLVIVAAAIMCTITYFSFKFGDEVIHMIPPKILHVFTRIMGLIVTAIAIQMVMTGIFNAIDMYGK